MAERLETPFDVSNPTADARLGRAVANKFGSFQFVWSESGVLEHRVRAGEPQGSWWEPEVACEECAGVNELATAISSTGELHVVYTRWSNGGEPQFHYLKRKALEWKRVFVPIAAK